MFLDRLAKYLAIVFGPHVWFIVLFFILLAKSGLTPSQLKIIAPSVLILQVIIPIIYLLIAPRLGWVGAWDMKNKEERKTIFKLFLINTLISMFIIHHFGNQLLFDLNLILIVLLTTLFFINHFWKISLHTSLNTSATILINYAYHWQLPWLYLVVPIIFWARLRLKKHTPNQLLAGIIVSSLILLSGLKLFHYL